MNRPIPRQSALSGSVIAPNAGNAVYDGKAGRAGMAGGGGGAFVKLTVRIPEDVADEARAAFWSTSARTSTRSLSTWVTKAIELKLEHDRAAFNGGRRFDPVPAGEIPTGRRS